MSDARMGKWSERALDQSAILIKAEDQEEASRVLFGAFIFEKHFYDYFRICLVTIVSNTDMLLSTLEHTAISIRAENRSEEN